MSLNFGGYRSCYISDLNNTNIDQKVKIAGWVHNKRDHGNLIFIDLRDYSGILQCTISNEDKDFHLAETISNETVVSIAGMISKRPVNTINELSLSGHIELKITSIDILSKSAVLPFPINDDMKISEELRLEYRFLDLRKQKMQNLIKLRSNVIRFIREIMWSKNFMEMQTPLLTISAPEGAKDYVVPSSRYEGEYYALPQAPQVFKQLIMTSGFEKYFQIAPCFRDEDSRADRLVGEFYQLDIEIAFATQELVFQEIEPIIQSIFKEFSNKPVSEKFHKLTYKQALNLYASDKPDLRNKLPVCDVTNLFKDSDFKLFTGGNKVKAIAVPLKKQSLSNAQLKDLESWAKYNQMQGLGYILYQGGDIKGPIAKKLNKSRLAALYMLAKQSEIICSDNSFTPPLQGCISDDYSYQGLLSDSDIELCANIFDGSDKKRVEKELRFSFDENSDNILLKNWDYDKECKFDVDDNYIVFFSYSEKTEYFANIIRTKMGEYFNITDNNRYEFVWITDFPFYEKDDKGNIDFCHNPFSMPKGGMESLNNLEPLEIVAEQYDIACNGVELSSGAIRNHVPEIMYRAFEIAGYDKAEADRRFGALLNAFKYGVPPHGGIAPGIDRIIMLLSESENARDTVLFPLNQSGRDLMLGAPTKLDLKSHLKR